jgi:hypothetical protein
MNITTELDRLSTADKLRAMEHLWDELCRHSDEVPSPAWHGDVLAQREQAVNEGKASFEDWETAKAKIHDALK